MLVIDVVNGKTIVRFKKDWHYGRISQARSPRIHPPPDYERAPKGVTGGPTTNGGRAFQSAVMDEKLDSFAKRVKNDYGRKK